MSLLEASGRQTRLVLEGDALALGQLGGCTVAVGGRSGPAIGLRVETWEVKDAGFGTQPFVGTLRRVGTQLFLDDRTTLTRLRLDLAGVGGLTEMSGSLVLIEGVIVGGHVLKVVTWRGLLAPGAGERPAR